MGLKENGKMLAEDEAENENEMNVAESLIKEGSERLQKAIKDMNFAEAESASALIDRGNKKIEVLRGEMSSPRKGRALILNSYISKEEKVKLVELKYKIQYSL